jgi:activator of HSP90 ATPase
VRKERRLRVSENRVQRITFRPTRDEVTGECRKLHNEAFNDLYSSSSIFRVIKSRRMVWSGHVVSVGKSRDICRVLVGKLREKEGSIILKWVLRKWDIRAGTDVPCQLQNAAVLLSQCVK